MFLINGSHSSDQAIHFLHQTGSESGDVNQTGSESSDVNLWYVLAWGKV